MGPPVAADERAFRRYPDWRCLRRLVLAAVVENFGYRQTMALVRARPWWTILRSGENWGDMTRVGFDASAAPAPDREVAAAASGPR